MYTFIKAYFTNKACKGKACIISVSKFRPDHMEDLPGYDEDIRKLSLMWDLIGFDVFIPETDPNDCLTAHVRVQLKRFQ